MINLIIADDHHLVRQGIRALLERDANMHVIDEAETGREALEKVLLHKPDVLLLDINMPEMDGIEVTRRVREKHLRTHVLILSMYSDNSIVMKAFRTGARGYLLKKSVAGDLLEGVRAVYQHEIYFAPALGLHTGDLIEEFSREENYQAPQLTSRELEICHLIASGNTNQTIANQLQISIKTVEKHRANLMRKLGVQDVVGLVREAVVRGIVYLER